MPDGTLYTVESQKTGSSEGFGSYRHDSDKPQGSKLDLPPPRPGESLLRDLDIILGISHNTPKQLDVIEKRISTSLLKTALYDFSDDDCSDDDLSDNHDFEDLTIISDENTRSLKVETFNRIYRVIKSLPVLKNNGVKLDPSKFIKTVVFWDWNGTTTVNINDSPKEQVKYDFVYLGLKRGMRVTLLARHRGWLYACAQDSKQRGWFPWYMLIEPETILKHN